MSRHRPSTSSRSGRTSSAWASGSAGSRASATCPDRSTDPPRRFATRFGSWVLRGVSSATFVPEGDGTRVTQEFETVGRISAVSSWVFSRGSYEGSFRGELEKFARLAERELR
ncbi:MAG TPA: SRPBCC family protein [Candidatus Limnocylindrales bacterium]|nr:SRPBCC family protein [Candidatus Limnocylindrales bacterium]